MKSKVVNIILGEAPARRRLPVDPEVVALLKRLTMSLLTDLTGIDLSDLWNDIEPVENPFDANSIMGTAELPEPSEFEEPLRKMAQEKGTPDLEQILILLQNYLEAWGWSRKSDCQMALLVMLRKTLAKMGVDVSVMNEWS